MTDHVMAATEAGGERLGERTVSTAPTLAEAAEFGERHQADYVTVRHGHDVITLYGREADGTWSVLLVEATALAVVKLRREHDFRTRPWDEDEDDWQVGDRGAHAPTPGGDYVSSAVGVDGEQFGRQVGSAAPTLAEAAEFGDLHEVDYVTVGRAEGDAVTLYGRDADGSWSVICADVDAETAQEVCLWFDLTHHYLGRSSLGAGSGGPGGHPLAHAPTPGRGGGVDAPRAISLVVDRIRSRGVDYPTQGLEAERFEAGWSVYAPVDVDESDPMAFLDLPVGRSVFLVSDFGRVKEESTSVPPQQACDLFTAEEAFVRRALPEEQFMAGFGDEVRRLESESDGPAIISGFTVDAPPEDVIAARASRLLAPIVQQLAQLGPQGWRRFGVVFSCTVSGEIARMRFWTDRPMDVAPVPEQIAVLVRRQRHLAARMAAGPWWRLLLNVTGGGEMSVNYDYGDKPLPEGELLAPGHYRDDLAAYPRAHTPAWLTQYVAGADDPTRAVPDGAATPTPGPRQDRSAPPATQPSAAGGSPERTHDAISARITGIGSDEGLGALRGIYPAALLPASRLGCFGIAAGVLAVLGIVVLATSDVLGVVPLAMAAAFAVYAMRGLAVNSRGAGTCVATFESGVVYIDSQGQAHVFRWHTTTVRQRIVEHMRNGVYTHTTHSYQLTGPDGAALTLDDSLADPEKWGREIQEGITRAQLPLALETIAGGGTVAFGPIQLSRQAVTSRDRSVPWSDIEQVKVSQGHVSLRVAGRWLSLIHTEVSQISNFFVFHAVAEHLRTLARDA